MAPCPLIGSHQPALWHLDAARGPSTPSFDHLVGALLEKPRHFEAKRLSSLEIDHQLEPSRLHNRQVSRLSAFKNPASVDAHLSVSIGDVCSVADQAAGNRKHTKLIDGWHQMARRERYDMFPLGIE